MNQFEKQAKTWLESDDNTYSFELISTSNSELEFTIADVLSFKVTTTDGNNLHAETEDEALQDWVVDLNKYLAKGGKSISDLLTKATELYDALPEDEGDGDSQEHDDEEVEYEIEGDDDLGDGDAFEPIDVTSARESTSSAAASTELLEISSKFNIKNAPKAAVDRLMKDYAEIYKADTSKFGYSAAPNGMDLFHWTVKLFGFDPKEDEIAKDLVAYKAKHGIDHVELDMTFPPEYPMKPPFIRVVKPRFQFHTGHITIGGSICMELLTSSGWLPSNDIESVLIQIRANIVAGKARIDMHNQSEYSKSEAEQAFWRVARQHGWEK